MKALVTLDGSAVSDSILDIARRVAELVPAAELHLLTVINPSAVHGQAERVAFEALGGSTGITAIQPPPPRVVETHNAALDRVAEETREALQHRAHALGQAAQVHVKFGKKASEEIIAAAREMQADMIVMTTHGRSGLSKMIAGSVAEAVIRESGLPVLVYCPRS
jgi:nucleotide-binding universal stress UspA family protein